MTRYLCKMCMFQKHSKRFIENNKGTLDTKEGTCESCEQGGQTVYDTDSA